MKIKYFVFVVVLIALTAAFVSAQDKKETDSLKQIYDGELINLLMSKDAKESGNAAKEIFSRGARMIPLLLSLEGNNQCFYGLKALGQWGSGLVIEVPSCSEDHTKISIETAALFLISAIFYEDLEFATPPKLCDFSYEEKFCGEVGNTKERIKKAWKATKIWHRLVKKQGIDYLREDSRDPFTDSGLSFF